MYHRKPPDYNAKPVMYRLSLRLTAGATPKTLASAIEEICGVGPAQALLWADLLMDGPFQFGCMTKDVAESTVAQIEYKARQHLCPLHASIEPITVKTI